MGSVELMQAEDRRFQQQSIGVNGAGVVLCEVAVCKTMNWSELTLKQPPRKPDLPVQHF